MLCYSCRLSQSTVVHSFKPMSREEESGFVNHPYKGMKLPNQKKQESRAVVNIGVFIKVEIVD